MMRSVFRVLALVVALGVFAAGCGGSDEEEGPPRLPRADTAAEWALRVVDGLMRPTNRDIETLTTLNNPQTRIFIAEGNKDTLDVLNERLTDLRKCSDRLVTIGPPPPDADLIHGLRRVHGALRRACAHYVKAADTLLVAVELLSSGRDDVVARGEMKLREAGPDAAAGAKAYDEAFKAAQTIPEFRIHGVQPPA
jgi:hypothetical protein